MLKGKVYVVIDGQAGSCGKGKIVGYLARHKKIDVSINNNTPNAGHTFVFDNGYKVITTHLPIAVVNPNVQLLIGAAAGIRPETLLKEIEDYSDLIGDRKIYIHERAFIVTEAHCQIERESIRSGSTFKGTAAAYCEKIMRKPGVVLAKDYPWPKDKVEIFDDSLMINLLENDKNILVETSQGFDLSLNRGLAYPNVTSKDCTAEQALSDCGIPRTVNTEVYMVFRPYPIRISNQSSQGEINSGDYGMSKELTWSDIEQLSGCKNLTELTTVTNKIRRVFEFEPERFRHAIVNNNPTYLVLNFAQHLDSRVLGISDVIDLCDCYQKDSPTEFLDGINPVMNFIDEIEREYNIPFAYVGTGPKETEIVDFNADMYIDNDMYLDDDIEKYEIVKRKRW